MAPAWAQKTEDNTNSSKKHLIYIADALAPSTHLTCKDPSGENSEEMNENKSLHVSKQHVYLVTGLDEVFPMTQLSVSLEEHRSFRESRV